MSFLKSGKYTTYCRRGKARKASGGRIRKSDIATWLLLAMTARNLAHSYGPHASRFIPNRSGIVSAYI
jgi:hypothetical protein